MDPPFRKRRVLALPGWRTNAEILEFQLFGLKKALSEHRSSPSVLLSSLESIQSIQQPPKPPLSHQPMFSHSAEKHGEGEKTRREEWEILCMNGANPARGPPVPEILALFGEKGPYFEWWTVEEPAQDGDKEGKEKKWNGLEKSLDKVVEVIREKGPFDAIVGFSQGGAMLSLVQALVESEPHRIPAHMRWKCAVMIGAVDITDQNYADLFEKERLGSLCPTIHVVGDLDHVRSRSEALHSKFHSKRPESTILIRYPEVHQPPTWRNSQQQLKTLASQMHRCTSPRLWWAFDFDGVLCDSAKETCLSGLKAGQLVMPTVFTTKACTDPEQLRFLLDAFALLRPRLEHGFHSTLLSYMVLREIGDVPVFDTQAVSVASKLEKTIREKGFDPVLEEVERDFGVGLEQLKTALHDARNKWIDESFEEWVNANGYYGTAVNAVKRLIDRGESVYIITTKHKDFATRLVEKAGLLIPSYRIYGQGMGAKEDVINKISEEYEKGKMCFFIEDRLETLDRVSTKLHRPTNLAFASWGYNDHEDVQAAKQKGYWSFTEDTLDQFITAKLHDL